MFKQGDLCYASVDFGCLGDLQELISYKYEPDRMNEISVDEAGDVFIFLRKDKSRYGDQEEVYVVYSIRCGKIGWLFQDEVAATHYDFIK